METKCGDSSLGQKTDSNSPSQPPDLPAPFNCHSTPTMLTIAWGRPSSFAAGTE